VMAAPDALLAAESVPHAAPLQPVPDNAQVTPLFCESFATVAAKVVAVPTATLALVCDKITVMLGAVVTVIAAAPVFVPSATEVAVNATLAGLGTPAGAV
jgi:hypothetical protein